MTDLSLYVYDPRETFLRKSRPAHLRPSRPSSPLPVSSPNLGSSTSSAQHQQQTVWTGKGLVSWALNELGVGKNLITGRLVRNADFGRVLRGQDMSPLEALMAGHVDGTGAQEAWGIEVSLGLKNATSGSFGFTPASQAHHAISRQPSPLVHAVSPHNTPSHPSSSADHRFQHPVHPPVPRRAVPAPHVPIAGPSAPTPQPQSRRLPNSTPAPTMPSRKPAPASKKKRPTPPSSRHLASVDTNANGRRGSGTKPPASAGRPADLPFEIPRHVYDNPDLLTKEQAERLIASPLFLDKISQMTGHPLVPKIKREREEEPDSIGSAKKPRFSRTDADGESTSKCYNCGRVKSYVWRQLTLDDGVVVTICNGKLDRPKLHGRH